MYDRGLSSNQLTDLPDSIGNLKLLTHLWPSQIKLQNNRVIVTEAFAIIRWQAFLIVLEVSHHWLPYIIKNMIHK